MESIQTKKLMVNPLAKALIFDLDGTLADTMGTHFIAWMAVAQEFDFPFSHETFIAHAGMPTKAILEEISVQFSLDLDHETIETVKEKIFFEKLDKVKPLAIVDEIARQYAGRMPMAIGTGSTLINANKILRAMNYPDIFQAIVGADSVKRGKPHPDTFLECARLLKVMPEQCQVFEDGQTGLDAANAAGMMATDIRPYL